MKYSEILGKSNPEKTLIEHTNDCLFWLPKVLDWNDILITKISEHYSISKSDLIKRFFMMVAFHDIGKATERFQDKVRRIKSHALESHALTSVPFIYEEIKDKPIKIIDKKRKISSEQTNITNYDLKSFEKKENLIVFTKSSSL